MASPNEYRLYTFVANHYLSPLQCGLQTAHVVSEIAAKMDKTVISGDGLRTTGIFADWCHEDKTIIICGAGNHAGVKDCWAELERINSALCLPAAIFHEDEQSMNGMATACGIVVPKMYYDVQFFEESVTLDQKNRTVCVKDAYWEHGQPDGGMRRYPLALAEGQFISHIKKYRLA